MPESTSLRNLTSRNYGKPPAKQNEFLQSLGAPHVDSFNYLLDEGLDLICKDLTPVEIEVNNSTVRLNITEIQLLPPTVPPNLIGVSKQEVWPTECRQSASTYKGRLIIKVSWYVDGVQMPPICKELGMIPIMIKSKACYLNNLTPEELIEHGEHTNEWGGYFIVKGLEKLIRMLLMTRRNYPIAVKRPSWKQRGDQFSDLGVLMRSVADDQTSVNNVLHFVTDGSAKLMFSYKKVLYYSPLMLIAKCLVERSDLAIYKQFMEGFEDDQYMKGCIQSMLRKLHKEGIHSSEDARMYVGKTFRVKLIDVPQSLSDDDFCTFIINRSIFPHLNDNVDKWNCLVMMTQKLFSVVREKSIIEGVDAVMMQEVLLGGHLYLQIIKDKLQGWLTGLKLNILKKASSNLTLNEAEMTNIINKNGGVESTIENFLRTGNVSSSSGLGLTQDKGLVIIAENINRMRYMSHFKAVHRGAFFSSMRTTDVRQLLPDAWGFICPVHTPDGAPCGLLNHLTKDCQISNRANRTLVSKLPEVLASLGMQPYSGIRMVSAKHCYITMLDGRVIGYVPHSIAGRLVNKLRIQKIKGDKVPSTLEIVLVRTNKTKGQFPGLFLFTNEARMMRPVLNLAVKQIELIGTFEQVYLDICITPEEAIKGMTTHQELSKITFLSNLACLIPMPDCNQSPRNMYQCQMGKQTMGTPCHNWHLQSETKLYRLQTPATPLFRPRHYDTIELDDFPMGTNAIVAVISYTGYDMEDAMIINKCSIERGFAHASIIKTEIIELKSTKSYFGLDPGRPHLRSSLGEDGLPFPGAVLTLNQALYCCYDYDKSAFITGDYKGKEGVVVENVKLCSSFLGSKIPATAIITLRLTRNPNVGDKFASRAGQKGICSQRWPAEDLPFTESGLVPDIVFNPHGFPSRMTIAMMIECMAGKSASVHGLVHDATPFEFSEDDTAIDYFGRLLQEGGYNYHGTERMYSGINGTEIQADIFFGVVHYQRLRHMVSDKWQVRSTGPIDILTHQPVKGRKRGGGVRFGEMERDSLISHGAAFLLQDRLFHCSDKSVALICRTCGTIVGPVLSINSNNNDAVQNHVVKCRICEGKGRIEKIDIPYIFRYLLVQLASVNIKVKMQIDGQ
ncbi:DNA-directed RNA polymerase I subunit RPA2 [Cimex lectularius]|uniref:DNA-directed RNA polymerase subunit beta n=1 Tax=Cimex lectularius TaxID=79782 RepID=A0A8I6RPX6_CIMLE|nr:DNA-directed RNA polymerase I subunit RPA2 [Cimex lectularius]